MGICGHSRERKNKKINCVKYGTKANILRIEGELEILENDINKMIADLRQNKSTPRYNKYKIEDLKRDIQNKIKSYIMSLKHKRVLKNNIQIVEDIERENKVVDQLRINNEFLKEENGNEDIIRENNEYLRMQKEIRDNNNGLFEEGDNNLWGSDKLHADDNINNFNYNN
jgi:hypothetical protein